MIVGIKDEVFKMIVVKEVIKGYGVLLCCVWIFGVNSFFIVMVGCVVKWVL